MSALWVSDAWFEQSEPATDVFSVPQSEAEHQAALAEIDLPPHPLVVMPSRWLPVLRWSAETLQLAVGASAGCGAVLAALSLLAWFMR